MTAKKPRAKQWTVFPHDASAFHYGGKALAAQWSRLHRGDCEPYPTAETLALRLKDEVQSSSPEPVAKILQDAWRAFHSGDFQLAHDAGLEVGIAGFAVAVKAAGVYASYLERNDHRAQELLLAASQHAENAIARLPKDPNAHYLYAFTLGRYSQRISILQALARGLAPKIERSLQQALKLEPKHADAHIALGLYHAEIIGKLGALAGGFSYGASKAKAVEHFKKAAKLDPAAPIGKLEYARGLKLMSGDADEVEQLLEAASQCTPMDAMEFLDREHAKSMLESA